MKQEYFKKYYIVQILGFLFFKNLSFNTIINNFKFHYAMIQHFYFKAAYPI